ncbi:hypothetical protein LTR84_004939 [Exophiala bonariae]|uniref:FAD-binding domain-containing protein n=1 Tax=Exophiala bonariae TaxID=1690606 RepID=A0AAV9NR18_9EURO|nr:hypothetical protein LTR84_004939 [Exophiala bonariae]
MTITKTKHNFRVIISGGGVCGLALANILERGQIAYTLLESNSEPAPQLGASIAINANGFRILDQLGCYDLIESQTAPFDYLCTYLPDGTKQRSNNGPLLIHKRLGYPFTMMERRFLLQTMYEYIQDKSKILLNKRVSRVDQAHDGVTVHCTDGTSYSGDVVVAADGIRSTVREEMWRHMSLELEQLANSERSAMSSSYRAMYGISTQTKGFTGGTFNQILGYGHSMLWSNEKSGRVFWFLFEKMDKRYKHPNIPRFTDDDAETLARRYLHIRLSETHTFADLWKNRVSFKLVALEEALHKKWTWERFVCAGDSAHKWTPNIGAGGNHAIESAAALANELYNLAKFPESPTLGDIESALTGYHLKRNVRAKRTFRVSNMVTRLEALRSKKGQFYALHIQPRLGDWLGNIMSMDLIGAEMVKFLPVPQKSLVGTMGFNPDFSNGYPTKTKPRILLALPLLMIAALSHIILSGILSSDSLSSDLSRAVSSGSVQFAESSWELPTNRAPFNILASVFAPSLLNIDSLQYLQAFNFLVELTPIWLIWIFESYRRANTVKAIRLLLVFGIAFQFFGIGAIGPVWFALHYIQSPLDSFVARDWRMINVAVAKTALVVVLTVLTVPTFMMYLLPDHNSRLTVNIVWQAFPITTSVLLHVIRKFVVQDTTQKDITQNVGADLRSVRTSIMLAATLSALCFNFIRWTAAGKFFSIFVPQWSQVGAALSWQPLNVDLVSGMRLFFQVDELSVFLAAFCWSALLLHDLRRESMTGISWSTAIVVGIAATYLVGPGAFIACFWLWREEIIASKTLKGTIVAQIK